MIIDTQVWADAEPPAWKNISEGKGRFDIITIIIYPRLNFSAIFNKNVFFSLIIQILTTCHC